jgi:hypothetical protein
MPVPLYAIVGPTRVGGTRVGYHSGQLLVQVGKRLYPSRVGAFRVGGSRLGLLSLASRLRTVAQKSLTIEDSGLTEAPTCNLSLKIPYSERPQNGEICIAAIGTLENRLFGGRLTAPNSQKLVGDYDFVDCEAVGFLHELQRRRIFETYTGYTAKEILEFILTNYTTGFFWYGLLEDGVAIDEITFNGETVLQACNELAGRSDYVFWVDPNKKVYFRPKTETVAPWVVSDIEIFSNLQVTPDFSELKNRVYVGYAETTALIQTFSGDGVRGEFYTSEPIESIISLQVDGTPVTYGSRYLEDNSGNDFAINFEQGYIKNSAHPILSSAQNLGISYLGKVPARITVNHLQSQADASAREGGDGIYETAIEDYEIIGRSNALQKAEEILDKYALAYYSASYRRQEYVFTYFLNRLNVGMLQSITARGRNLSLQIDKIQISIWSHSDDEALGIEMDVSLKDRKSGFFEIFQSIIKNTEQTPFSERSKILETIDV